MTYTRISYVRTKENSRLAKLLGLDSPNFSIKESDRLIKDITDTLTNFFTKNGIHSSYILQRYPGDTLDGFKDHYFGSRIYNTRLTEADDPLLAQIELQRAIEYEGKIVPAQIDVELYLSNELAAKLNITVDVERDPERLRECLKPLDERIGRFVATR